MELSYTIVAPVNNTMCTSSILNKIDVYGVEVWVAACLLRVRAVSCIISIYSVLRCVAVSRSRLRAHTVSHVMLMHAFAKCMQRFSAHKGHFSFNLPNECNIDETWREGGGKRVGHGGARRSFS